MTTIAYKDGRLVMDTQVNGGDDSEVFVGRCFKGGKTEDGHLWAACGFVHALPEFRAWVEKRAGDPPVFKETTFVLVTPDGEVRTWEGEGWSEYQAEYYAWGSGRDYALGAMAVGASADQAVEAACRHDPWSSEPMLVEVLGDAPEAAEAVIGEAEVVQPPAPKSWREEKGLA